MALRISIHKKVFTFGFQARTSRGAMRDRTSWFLVVREAGEPDVFGIGECAPLQGLSPEWGESFESSLDGFVARFNDRGFNPSDVPKELSSFATFLQSFSPSLPSSIAFGFETALLDLARGGTRSICDSPFLEGTPIPINGLIWMGGLDMMLQQIEIKIRDGYRCIKLKVGGLDFEKECDILQYVRRKYFREDITIRLDANGAFKKDDAMYKLHELAKYQVHSIEQPLKVGSDALPELCRQSPIPIALDEELIGRDTSEAEQMLERIRPSYIILKPSLHGGLTGAAAWIKAAENLKIGWWITSALESNIGLNAIAQFTGTYAPKMPQGLGTGSIYTDNIPSPLEVSNNGFLSYNLLADWDLSEFSALPGGPESTESLK